MLSESKIYGGTVADYLNNRQGHDLIGRLQAHTDWLDMRYEHGVDPYSKSSDGPILPFATIKDRKGNTFEGINLASQDYLSLSSHKKIHQAAKNAIDAYGVHSAGSSALSGNTAASVKLESDLSDYLGYKDCTVFPTGWAAAYGLIRCLITQDDHVVIDQLAHASLIEGAYSATRNIHVFSHLSLKGLERRLKQIRKFTASAGILIVTESLFSMDSDTPDIKAHQELAKKYNATLMLDAAHDIGSMGKNGLGLIEEQDMVGEVDLIMGSFSKTFASNGGFVACNHPALKLALRYSAGPLTFSNALSPVQANVVSAAVEIIRSTEGEVLRKNLLANSIYLRDLLIANNFEVMGAPSAIVPVLLGGVMESRLITKNTIENGGLVNLVEYPAVSKNSTRFRLQLMSSHSNDQLDTFVKILLCARDAVCGSTIEANRHFSTN